MEILIDDFLNSFICESCRLLETESEIETNEAETNGLGQMVSR